MIRDAFGAELDAGVGAFPSEQLHLQPQLEITIGLRGAEELVSRNPALQRPTDDGAILDAEDREIPLPSGEGLPVKNGRLASAGRQNKCEYQQQH